MIRKPIPPSIGIQGGGQQGGPLGGLGAPAAKTAPELNKNKREPLNRMNCFIVEIFSKVIKN
jgi:hypothetical protein